jgi:hypothetical protein
MTTGEIGVEFVWSGGGRTSVLRGCTPLTVTRRFFRGDADPGEDGGSCSSTAIRASAGFSGGGECWRWWYSSPSSCFIWGDLKTR